QVVAREVHRHADKPRSPGAIELARWPLDRAHERLLNEVVRVSSGARHPIAESPEEAFVVAEEIRNARRYRLGLHRVAQAALAAAERPTCAMASAPAARALAKLASARSAWGPTQSPAR